MTVPATWEEAIEARALDHARSFVRQVRDEKIMFRPGLPLSFFAKEDSQQLWREFFKSLASDPLRLIDLTNYARAGWDLADEALREVAIEYEHRDQKAPPPLRAYIMEALDPRRRFRRPTGPKKTAYWLRDISIVCVVADVCSTFGLRPTRNQRSNRERASGCSIVARALYEEGPLVIGEPAIVEIWRR